MNDDADSWLDRLPLADAAWQNLPWLGIAAAVLVTLTALALRAALEDFLPPGLPYVTFFPAVVISAFVFGVKPGIVSATLGFFFSWYWFIPPAGFAVNLGVVTALALYLFVVVVDIALIHWMQMAQARLVTARKLSRDLAETRALLFQELQHRVGNNLQMVGSMLALQKRGLSGEAAQAIGEAAQRIGLIGAMQRDLYRPDGEPAGLLELVHKVCRETVAAHGRDDVSLSVQGDRSIMLAPSLAIPASVVVAESVANALEHGLGPSGGKVSAQVERQDGGAICIAVSDDGRGLPEGFAADRSKSLGLRLTAALARQIGGTYSLRREGALTVAELVIAPEDHSAYPAWSPAQA